MHLDILARKNLELTQSNSLAQKKGSLLWLLDKTKTAMGGRLIKKFVDEPLRDEGQINKRLDAVEELSKDLILRNNIYDAFNGFTKQINDTPKNDESTNNFDLLDMVRKTIRGDFGNGEERRNALGDKYDEVQKQVNLNLNNGLTKWEDIRLF